MKTIFVLILIETQIRRSRMNLDSALLYFVYHKVPSLLVSLTVCLDETEYEEVGVQYCRSIQNKNKKNSQSHDREIGTKQLST